MQAKPGVAYAKKLLESISSEAESEAEILVSHILNIGRGSLNYTQKQIEEKDLEPLINRRLKGEPLQYVLGKWGFYKGEFLVGEGVLIPRQDTETLVETAVEFLKGKENPRVIDLCSGSGCVAISIATDYPKAEVIACEKYEKAYSFLEKNIEFNKTQNVKPLLLDITKETLEGADLIVSNPPYITKEDMENLQSEVKREPETALYGGEDGLYFYRVIAKTWSPLLKKGGMLALEIGIGQEESVKDLLKKAGLKNIGTKKDLCGVQRVVFGTAD